jgi:SAM-dependent methyltransferase
MESALSAFDWEAMYAPYDQQTYQAVLDLIGPEDIILDIGAGDLRLARQMARLARKVYAVEINLRVLDQARTSRDPLPANLIPVYADARGLDFPADITLGLLLMRHCTCFRLYAEKLQKAGVARLITNARWHMYVEVINLLVQRTSFVEMDMGWYACICGGTGFKEGPAKNWSLEMDRLTYEVSSCPQCMQVS